MKSIVGSTPSGTQLQELEAKNYHYKVIVFLHVNIYSRNISTMFSIFTKILVSALSLVIVAHLVPGISIEGAYAAIITAVVLGTLNILVKPLLVVLTLPITIVTLGLFIFVINAGLFMLAAHFIVGFTVSGFWVALLGSLAVSIISTIINKFVT